MSNSNSNTPANDNDSYVVLDPERMERLRLERGLSRRQFADIADISPTTAYRFFKRQRVQTRIARRLFDGLEIWDMLPYLIRANSADDIGRLDTSVLAEWQIENALTHPMALSNGLEFRLFQLVHRVLPDTFGRGKCYDLSKLNTRDTERVREQLTRHPTVCRTVGTHPQLPVNERVLYSEDRLRFWVVDRWFDGITLEDKLRYGPLAGPTLARLMTQLLHGLAALHDHQIIRRELSPRYIVLAEPQGDALLTELELSKLLEGAVSVSTAWDADPYRAPEIENDQITPSVDLYSWAQVLIAASTGKPPTSPADPTKLDELALPATVKNVARQCLSLSYKFRPSSVREVMQKISGWSDD